MPEFEAQPIEETGGCNPGNGWEVPVSSSPDLTRAWTCQELTTLLGTSAIGVASSGVQRSCFGTMSDAPRAVTVKTE
eukprot:1724527-Amphidinium_carterae.1